MTQVLQHDYGKGKVTLTQIRAAIKAVRAEKSTRSGGGTKHRSAKKMPPATQKSRKKA